MIDIPDVLAQMARIDCPNVIFSLAGKDALMINSKNGILIFGIHGSIITAPAWCKLFRSSYDLANPPDLVEFISTLKLSLSD